MRRRMCNTERCTLSSHAVLFQTHMDLGGQVQLSGDYPAQMQLTFADFNIGPVLRMASSSDINAESSLVGKITLSGPLADAAKIQADAEINTLTATVGGIPMHSQGPLLASLRDGVLRLQPVHVQGTNMDFVAGGTVDLMKGDALRLHSEGTIDAALASVMNKDIQSSGQVKFVVNARGTAHKPNLQGRAELSHINMHMVNVTNGLTDMNGTMAFDQDRLVVQQLKGSSGGGDLEVEGIRRISEWNLRRPDSDDAARSHSLSQGSVELCERKTALAGKSRQPDGKRQRRADALWD